jgi:hypothetical protein
MNGSPQAFQSVPEFAVVEVMGHQIYAGRCSEQTIAGVALLRVDVPEQEGIAAFSKLLGAGAIFSVTPCTEEYAAGLAKVLRSRPFPLLDLAPINQPRTLLGVDVDPDDEDQEDWDEDGCPM